MKKIIGGILVSMLFTGYSFGAGLAEQNTGCGLGTMLWESNADDSMVSQALQATTNASTGSQTFGISSGTLGCKQPSKIALSDTIIKFASANLDNLAKDIAVGQGESLNTLAELLAVPTEKRSQFSSNLQSNFLKIFPTGSESYDTVLETIYTLSMNS